MKKLLDLLSEEMGQAFEAAGYDKALGKVGFPIALIFVSFSVMVPWLARNSIIRRRS